MLLIDNGWTSNTWAVRPLLVSSLLLIGWRFVLKGGGRNRHSRFFCCQTAGLFYAMNIC